MTVLLLHYIHNDQEEARFITYEASLILMIPPPVKWCGIAALTEALSCLWTTAELGVCLPLESWNSWAILPQFGVDCCGHAPHSSILQLGSPYLTYFVFIWVSRKQGFSGRTNPPPKKNTTVIFTPIIFVYMCGPWIGKGGRERDRESCVCKVSTHSHEIISDEEESEKDKYHMISLTCDILKKWTYL